MTNPTFHFPSLPPPLNRQWRRGQSWGGSPVTYLTQEAKDWREKFTLKAKSFFRKAGIKKAPKDKEVELRVVVRVNRSRDVDSTIKSVLDALQGVLYDNDSQVSHVDLYRYKDKKRLGVYVTIL